MDNPNNDIESMQDAEFWYEYTRKHPKSAQRDCEVFWKEHYSEVQMAWIGKRADTTPTSEQIERGLTDENWGVRCDWAGHSHWTATSAQVERGLEDDNWHVREAWAKHTDFTPTPEQVERGLSDKSEEVRSEWAKRNDFTPMLAQMERGLADDAQHVRDVWMERSREMCDALLYESYEEEVSSI
jgi:hypothetical protein